jgi:hypothetical protein
MSREAGLPSRTLIVLAFALAFGGDLDLVADLRGLPPRDLPLAFGFALLSVIIRSFREMPHRLPPPVLLCRSRSGCARLVLSPSGASKGQP